MKALLPLTVVLLVAGCASYAPAPLATLSAPSFDTLTKGAASIDRPWLKPVTIDLSAPLTPDGTAALAVFNNPDLVALRARFGVAEAQVFAAGLLPDPTFSLGADKVVAGPDTVLGIAGALGLDLNALRQRTVTRDLARARMQQVRLDLAWAEWQTAGQAKIQAVRIAGLTRIVASARLFDTSAKDQMERTARAAGRGDVSASAAQAARLASSDASERLRAAERELLTARQELARLLGLPPDTMLAIAQAPLPDLPPSKEQLFLIAQESRSDLAALRAGYAAQEANVHKAILDQFPSLGLTINGSRDTGGNRLIGPAVSFTLPLWNRNRGGIAIEQATRGALKAEYEARLFQTQAELAAAWNGIMLSRRQLEIASAGLGSLERQAAAAEAAAKRGDVSQAAAAALRQVLIDRGMQMAQAELALREQTIALELLSGEPIEGWK